ncbi:MAG: tRNA lysidine(34) synthetase TilS [Deltaproteobacteria bacterium]|nr:tRNA lysidine(34) synthetase TilS [Deltaproteobacteria bacterium]
MTVLRKNFNKSLGLVAKKTIASYNMLKPADKVLVGVSGGADSIALLHFLHAAASEYKIFIAAAHLNHLIRGKQAFEDEEFVKKTASVLKVPFFSAKEDVNAYKKKTKKSLEDAARDIRYKFFEKTALKNGYNKIALAHNADDNAELALMRIIRGAGISGLCGIPAVREGKYIRPFIKIEKKAIYRYIKAKNLKHVEDKSNCDTKFLRNRIRQNLLPLLKKEYNPNIAQTLNNISSIAKKEEEWILRILPPIFEKVIYKKDEDRITLLLDELNKIAEGGKRRIVREALNYIKTDLKNVSFAHIASIVKLTKNRSNYASADISDNILVVKNKNFLIFTKKQNYKKPESVCYEYKLKKPGTVLIKEARQKIRFSEIAKKSLPKNFLKEKDKSEEYFDADKIVFPLTIRNFRNGDKFIPLGMTGGQKLKIFFINNKISANKRNICPIVLSKDKIIWIAGLRASNICKITEKTKKVIKGEVFLA